MIVVKDIEYIEVDDDEVEIVKIGSDTFGVMEHPELAMRPEIKREFIKGERFHNNGVQFCFGLTKKAEEILRMPMRCFGELTSEVSVLRRISDKTGADNILLEQRLNDFTTASLWQRIKYLFTGNL